MPYKCFLSSYFPTNKWKISVATFDFREKILKPKNPGNKKQKGLATAVT